MKKLPVLFSILFITIYSSAQVKFAPVVGAQLTGISVRDLGETDFKGNFTIGVLGDYNIPQSRFYLQAQVLYAPMGYKNTTIEAVDEDGNFLGRIAQHNIQYIQVPVHILYGGTIKYAKGRKSGIMKIGAGPYFAFKTGDKMKLDYGETFGNGTAMPSFTNGLRPVLFGFGMTTNIELSSFIFAFHFERSVNGIYENLTKAGPGWKIAGFGFSIGYFISKTKKQ